MHPQPTKLELSWAPGHQRRQPLHARRNGADQGGERARSHARRRRQVCPRLGNHQLRHGHGPRPARRVGRIQQERAGHAPAGGRQRLRAHQEDGDPGGQENQAAPGRRARPSGRLRPRRPRRRQGSPSQARQQSHRHRQPLARAGGRTSPSWRARKAQDRNRDGPRVGL